MRFAKMFGFFLLLIYLIGCQKSKSELSPPIDPLPTVDTLPPEVQPAIPDSIFLLSSIDGNFKQGDKFKFFYDSSNRLTSFSRPYSWERSGCNVRYKNDIISHIIASSGDINNWITKVSIIFIYDDSANCTKIYYKKAPHLAPDNSSPYYSDLNDGNLGGRYDSLIYSSTNQLQQIHHIDTIYGYKAERIIKFSYENSSDTSLNKIEEYRLTKDGDYFLYDQLLLTTNSIDNPVNKLLWFFPFIRNASAIATGSGSIMSLPLLYDGPSTYLGLYASLVPKCITNYKVYNNWGVYNYTTTIFDYNYSKDSLLLKTNKRDFYSFVNYNYKKVKR